MGRARILLFATLLTSLSPASSAGATDSLVPCPAAVTESPLSLALWSRVLSGLQLDRPPVDKGGHTVARIIVTPGWNDEGERAVSVYLPDSGPARVESVRAAEGIRGKNHRLRKLADEPVPTFVQELTPTVRVVPVSSHWRSIDRSIAGDLSSKIAALVRDASFAESDGVVLHPTSYYFISWQEGVGEVCGFASSPEEGSVSWKLARLSELLGRFAEQGASQEAVEAAVENLGARQDNLSQDAGSLAIPPPEEEPPQIDEP